MLSGFKRTVAALLCAAMALALPGPASYAAAGNIARSPAGARRALPALMPQSMGSLKAPLAPLAALPALQGLAPLGALPVLTAAGQSAAEGARAPKEESAAKKDDSLLERLAAEQPDFAAQGDAGKTSAHDDFTARIGGGKPRDAAGGIEASLAGPKDGHDGRLKKGDGMPQPPDDNERPSKGGNDPDVDDLGNERRDGSDSGPDGQGAPDGSGFFALLPVFGGLALSHLQDALLLVPLVVISLALHEIAHARVANKLGDRGPMLAGRGSFTWRGLLSHVDPFWTLVVPLISLTTTGVYFGMAKPVQVDVSRFKNPVFDNAKTALAGPAANFALAGLGALAFHGLAAAGLPALASVAALFALINVSLALFNLIPFYPLDGHHVLRAMLPKALGDRLDSFYRSGGLLPLLPLIAFLLIATGSGIWLGAIGSLSALLLGVVALGGQGTDAPVPVSDPQTPVEYVVVLKNAGDRFIAQDAHLSLVDIKKRGGVKRYAQLDSLMRAEIASADSRLADLEAYGASPVAIYRRINAATLKVDAALAPRLKQWLESLGHSVYDNSRREIVPPVEPEADPLGRGAVSMDENLQITGAAAVVKAASQRWGAPDMGLIARLLARLKLISIPQPPVGVIDTGADVKHPLLKRVKAVKNASSDPDVEDDNGHGTWVASMILNFAQWLKNLTAYKAFVNGGATLDDILKALTMAGNDGNIIISNSWGSNAGDPESPDSQLVGKLAQEGHVMVFAAGNAGPSANTIGSPAIAYYRDAATGAPRVLAVAAARRDRVTSSFSSRGPGSRATKDRPGYPHRPDLKTLGENTDGAWLGGRMRAISGTSMATPAVAGALALLAMLFGVTTKGERLDAIVNAVMSTLDKTGESPDNEGQGFLNVEAAFKALQATMRPVYPGFIARFLLTTLGRRIQG